MLSTSLVSSEELLRAQPSAPSGPESTYRPGSRQDRERQDRQPRARTPRPQIEVPEDATPQYGFVVARQQNVSLERVVKLSVGAARVAAGSHVNVGVLRPSGLLLCGGEAVHIPSYLQACWP